MKIVLHKVIEAIAKVVVATAQVVRTFGGRKDSGQYVVAIVGIVSGTALCWHLFDLLAAR
jgi:hypothetical protein